MMRVRTILTSAMALLAGCNVGAANNTANEIGYNMAADDMNLAADTNEMSDAANTLENAAQSNTQESNTTAALDPIVYCDVAEARLPASECAQYRSVWTQLEPGRAAIDAPPRMTRGQSEAVSFALTRPGETTDPGHPSGAADPANFLDSAAEATAVVNVGRRMAVRLEGDGFRIAPEGLIERDLQSGGAARWDWTVTPERHGRRRLRLSAFVIVRGPGEQRSENLIRTLAQDVEVVVTRGDQTKDVLTETKGWFGIATEWLLALAALIGGGIYGLVVAIRKFRKKGNEQAAPDQDDGPHGGTG